jgi:hypothetical protein
VISRIKRRTQNEGVTEQGTEENIWTYEGGNNRRLEKNNDELHNLNSSYTINRMIS